MNSSTMGTTLEELPRSDREGSGAESGGPVAPALLPFEAVNALKYSGHYEGDRLVEAADSLGAYGIEFVPFQSGGPLADIATAVGITPADAAYVALAVDREATASTADSKLVTDRGESEYADSVAHIEMY